jgi:hypothetical protein
MRILGITALFCCISGASVMAGPIAYATASGGQFGTVDLSNGNFSQIGNLANPLVGLGSSGGILYGLDSSTGQLIIINPTNAAVTAAGNTGLTTATVFGSLTTGALFAVDSSWGLWSINPATAATTVIGTIAVNKTAFPARGSYGYSDSLAGDANYLYFTLDLWTTTPGDVLASQLYRVDPATGAATVIGPTGPEDIAGSAFIGGTLYGFTGSFVGLPHEIITLSTSTGAATFVTNVPSGPSSLYGAIAAESITAVPEPGTLALVGLALAVAGYARKRSAVSR